jgi:hypothetical protein
VHGLTEVMEPFDGAQVAAALMCRRLLPEQQLWCSTAVHHRGKLSATHFKYAVVESICDVLNALMEGTCLIRNDPAHMLQLGIPYRAYGIYCPQPWGCPSRRRSIQHRHAEDVDSG